jgi:cytoskeletal protein RodZ
VFLFLQIGNESFSDEAFDEKTAMPSKRKRSKGKKKKKKGKKSWFFHFFVVSLLVFVLCF